MRDIDQIEFEEICAQYKPGRVFTRDIGQCKRCGDYTSSGMKRWCDRCAVRFLIGVINDLENPF